MSDAVAVPLWIFIGGALLAAWAAYEHIALPVLRWMVSPSERVIDDISTRLRIALRPFQRTRRQALIHRLATDPKVHQASTLR